MSNRSTPHSHQNSNRGNNNNKTQMKFVPKTLNPKTPNANPTLSSTMRQSIFPAADSHPSIAGGIRKGRVRMGPNGVCISSKIHGSGESMFINYLPQDEAVAVGLGAEEGGLDPVESQRAVDLLNRELGRLLKLKNPRDFWREVAADPSLNEFLDSFLQFRSRWYDFPCHGVKGIVAGVIVGDLELSHRVFMLLYRISSNRDPGVCASDSLSQKDHEALLQEKKLLDLPKLLDICAVYGRENEDLTRSLILNAINAQHGIHESFTTMMSHFLGIVQTMYQRCSSSLETLITAGGCEVHEASRLQKEYLEVMDFLNDAVVSMDAFVNAYKPAALFFSCPVDASPGNEELIKVLATLHDSLLPSLLQGFQIILSVGDKTSSSIQSDVSSSLRILSARIVDLGWRLLDNCYLSDELFKDNIPFSTATKMFPASVDDPLIRTEILIQTFKEIIAVPQHALGKQYKGTYLQHVDKRHQIMKIIQSQRSSGWLLIDDEQYQHLTGMTTHPVASVSRAFPSAQTSMKSDDVRNEEDAAIAESIISQVKDLFPDFGKGFIFACLEVYDHNSEEVIQRILEGTLHEDLKTLDTSMETVPPKPTPLPAKKDKGKGILIESTTATSSNKVPPPQKPRPEVTTSSSTSRMPPLSSSVGRFVRKPKNGQADNDPLDFKDEKHVEKTAALLSQYEYEDEYDDSFDDLGMTVESGVEATEVLGERMRSSMGISSSSHAESQSSSSKWGSKKKPQFYVKDGKNYSYKVEGAVAVADQKQASLVNQAQKEMIHGLARGGNLPIGALRRMEEDNEERGEENPELSEAEDAGRGRGRGGGRRGGGRSNHYRKDRALKKQMAGVGGF